MATGMEDVEDAESGPKLDPESDTPLAEEGEPETPGPVRIPASVLGGRQVKPGQVITLRVVEVSEDGDVEAEMAEGGGEGGGEGAPDANAEFDQMAAAGGGY